MSHFELKKLLQSTVNMLEAGDGQVQANGHLGMRVRDLELKLA